MMTHSKLSQTNKNSFDLIPLVLWLVLASTPFWMLGI